MIPYFIFAKLISIMEFDDIIRDLKNKNYKPIYFLTGEETYFIDQISNFIADNVLNEAEKSFDLKILYGQNADTVSVTLAARCFPMMGKLQVVIVKEAQYIKDIENLVHYSDNPLKSTILVVNYKYKELDKRKKLYISLQKNGIVFNSVKIYENKIPDWINKYLSGSGYSITPEAAVILTEYLGNDLDKIVNELTKLILTLSSNDSKITSDKIEKYSGISKEFNNFELQKAIVNRDVVKANRIINYFEKNPRDNPLVVTISNLFTFFLKIITYHCLKDKSKTNVVNALKINPYFVSEYEKAARVYNLDKLIYIISAIRECDVKSKGVGNASVADSDLLKELIFKIIH